jgi:CRP-like cAMP-binding protein
VIPTIDEVAAVPLFASLGGDDLRTLAPWFEVQDASEGVRLIGEGAAGYSFFVLDTGTAAVTVSDAVVATLGPGDFFGEAAILGDGRRTASVTTTSAARLFVLFGTEFRKLQQQFPAVAERIEARLRERLGEPVS